MNVGTGVSLFSSSFQMQVWDTAGQERFRTITQSYYRSAHGALVAYDITRRPTFESVPHWIHEIRHYGAAGVVLILIGEPNGHWVSYILGCFHSLMCDNTPALPIGGAKQEQHFAELQFVSGSLLLLAS